MDQQKRYSDAIEGQIKSYADTAGKIAYQTAKDLDLPVKDIQAATATAIGTAVAINVTKPR